jgi:hypothetical protein
MNEEFLIVELRKLRRWLLRPRVNVLFPQKVRRVATPEDVLLGEETLGFTLPPLLTRMYLEVGNGGFGPGYGLIGIGARGEKDDLGNDLVRGYEERLKRDADEPTWEWPIGWVPLASWGGGVFSCCNLLGSTEVRRFRLSRFHEERAMDAAFEDEAPTLFQFMADWVSGK